MKTSLLADYQQAPSYGPGTIECPISRHLCGVLPRVRLAVIIRLILADHTILYGVKYRHGQDGGEEGD